MDNINSPYKQSPFKSIKKMQVESPLNSVHRSSLDILQKNVFSTLAKDIHVLHTDGDVISPYNKKVKGKRRDLDIYSNSPLLAHENKTFYDNFLKNIIEENKGKDVTANRAVNGVNVLKRLSEKDNSRMLKTEPSQPSSKKKKSKPSAVKEENISPVHMSPLSVKKKNSSNKIYKPSNQENEVIIISSLNSPQTINNKDRRSSKWGANEGDQATFSNQIPNKKPTARTKTFHENLNTQGNVPLNENTKTEKTEPTKLPKISPPKAILTEKDLQNMNNKISLEEKKPKKKGFLCLPIFCK
jgi:hypothetical protein